MNPALGSLDLSLQSKISRIVPGLPGWCTVDKALAMARMITCETQTIVEIGVFGGRSLVAQALTLRHLEEHGCCPAGTIYGIDPWHAGFCLEGKNDPENDDWWKAQDLEAIHRACMASLWEHHLHSRAVVIRSGSSEASRLFGYETVDILHIDGNHSELASTRDVDLWLPKVKRGGYIWMDDTNWATTQNAVAKLDRSCRRVADVGSCRLYATRFAP